jgi:hypothetical protein
MLDEHRGAMAADDALKRQGMEIRFRIRETFEWKLHAAELKTEMLRRGMMFEVIDWSEIRRGYRSRNDGFGLRSARSPSVPQELGPFFIAPALAGT